MSDRFSTSRRRFLINGSLLAAGLGVASGLTIGSAARAAEKTGTLVYSGFGGSYEQAVRAALFDDFSRTRDVRVLATTGASDVGRIAAMVRAHRTEWDLVDAQGATLAQFQAQQLLQALPANLVDPSLIFKPDLITPFSLPWYQFSQNIFWNTAALKQEPTSWADVWNVEKFPGKRGLSKLPWFSLEIALLADGVALDQLYPLDVDRAFASLDRIKQHAVFLDASGLANAAASQEIVIGISNLARLKTVQKAGVPVRHTWAQALIEIQQLVVLKDAPNQTNAFDAVAFAMQPEPQRRILDSLGYTPTLKSVLDEIDPDLARDLAGTDATRHSSFYLNPAWWGEHGATVARRWQDWLANI